MDPIRRALCAGVASLLVAGPAFASPDKPVIGVVVKIGGIPWFNAMEAGIKRKSAELGVKATMIGPTSADPALQVRAIEDLIAQKVDVIGVVPNDAEVLEPVLERARAAGIKVITHESPNQKNADYDFELASVKGFGEAYGKSLVEALGGKGEYAVFVGGLTVPLHNAWADAAIAYIKANAPDMKQAGERYGVAENVDQSRSTALDLMRTHPDLKGFLAFGSQGRHARHHGGEGRTREGRHRDPGARDGAPGRPQPHRRRTREPQQGHGRRPRQDGPLTSTPARGGGAPP